MLWHFLHHQTLWWGRPTYRHHGKWFVTWLPRLKGPHRLNSSTQRLLQSIHVENERRLYLGFLYQLNIIMWVLLFMDGAKDSTIWLYNISERQRERERWNILEVVVVLGRWSWLPLFQAVTLGNANPNTRKRNRQEQREQKKTRAKRTRHDNEQSIGLKVRQRVGPVAFLFPPPPTFFFFLSLTGIYQLRSIRSSESCSSVETRDRRLGWPLP